MACQRFLARSRVKNLCRDFDHFVEPNYTTLPLNNAGFLPNVKMENILSLMQKFPTTCHQVKVSKPCSTNTFQKSPETVVIALPWFAAVLSVLFASIVFCY